MSYVRSIYVLWPGGGQCVYCDYLSPRLLSRFSRRRKKSGEKIKYLKNKKSFSNEMKKTFIICKGLSVARNCLRPESVPLKKPLSD